MNINEIIKYPLLSEKTYAQMATGVYTFAVDKRTNKTEIKQAVQFIFDVKVASVNVINVDKKPKKIGRFAGFTTGYKKAIVKLAEGQINIFPEDAPAPEVKETKAAKKVAVKEMSEAESKAAAKIAAKIAEKEKAIDKKDESPAAKAWEKEEVETGTEVVQPTKAKAVASKAKETESPAAKAWDKEEELVEEREEVKLKEELAAKKAPAKPVVKKAPAKPAVKEFVKPTAPKAPAKAVSTAKPKLSKEVLAKEAAIDKKDESQAAKAWEKEEVETGTEIVQPNQAKATPASKAKETESPAAKAWDKEEESK